MRFVLADTTESERAIFERSQRQRSVVHQVREARESCATGAFGALLPFSTSSEAFLQLQGFSDAVRMASDVSLEAPFDAPGGLDAVNSAVLIEEHDAQPCSEVMSARVTQLPWGVAAVSARLREVFPQTVH